MPLPFQADMVPSPCIKVCQFTDGVCAGCFRTIKERNTWYTLTVPEKRDTLALCRHRRLTEELSDMLGEKKQDAKV